MSIRAEVSIFLCISVLSLMMFTVVNGLLKTFQSVY